jgi:putative protease
LHDRDLEELPDFVRLITKLKADAVIVSDLGVITAVQNVSDIPIHLSTQASCNNLEASLFWKKVGVKRLILGRETSITDAATIKRETGLEVELFIHGSMCMAYSNCVISNFTQGRIQTVVVVLKAAKITVEI